MASDTLHRRLNNDQLISTKPSTTMTKQEKTNNALRSLTIGIATPLALTTISVVFFGSSAKYRAANAPFWFPPLWLIHLASLLSSLFMGLSAWLVWADGGFHAQSSAFALYIAQISSSILWGPVVLIGGAAWIGLFICLVHFGALFGCYNCFQSVNPFARDLVKPCLAWVAYLSLVNCELVYLGI